MGAVDAFDLLPDPPMAPKKVRLPLTGDWDADLVKKLRDHLHLTQGQFAERLGSRQQTVSEWECGKYKPRGMSRTILDAVAKESDFDGGSDGGSDGG